MDEEKGIIKNIELIKGYNLYKKYKSQIKGQS